MDNKLPYEEGDIHLPDAEASWQKMKALLDEKKRRRVPPFFASCASWGLFGLMIIAGGLYVLKPSIWSGKDESADRTSIIKGGKEDVQKPFQNKSSNDEPTITNNETIPPEHSSLNTEIQTTENAILKNDIAENLQQLKQTKPHQVNKTSNRTNNSQESSTTNAQPTQNIEDIKKNNKTEEGLVTTSNPIAASDIPVQTTEVAKDSNQPSSRLTGDTTAIQPALPSKEKESKNRSFYLTAGLGVQQAIPIAGQGAYPYNYYGRRGSLQDYIPSLYLRLHKDQKWFVQGEFRYGAPQSVKDFSYSKETRYDSLTSELTTTTLYLKKTYYHQLPLSFNYYVAPKLSVGIGGVYSRFYGAVTEEEVRSKNVFSGAEKTATKIVQVPRFNDSFLYKTQLHLLLQTDYQWKRLSVGLRYKKDIQPYIKYTEPDGKVDVRKNQSLEAIIRFQIWKSKK